MTRNCPRCSQSLTSDSEPPKVRRAGRFYRKSDGQWVKRFLCLRCKHRFSNATFHPCYRQKKRHFNYRIEKGLSSGISERRLARFLCLTRKTVAKKITFLGLRAQKKLENYHRHKGIAFEFEFDDQETFEHSKCLPVSITWAVEAKTRRILGFEVSRMKANGLLAKKSLKKYGSRKDERARGRARLFKRLKPLVHPEALIRSDQNPHYPEDVKRCFPGCVHVKVKGRKPLSIGQGELKKGGFDPIFSLNHTCAMTRYGVANLIRKTWCTAKKAERLAERLWIYSCYHNLELI